ncbi:unnamed protein product [Clonostachys rhizophaga]|uniref:NodB homology domain-containing protein n=1 Tax=Clonostachys rhizophaga TaxID=160324 RepID=A0A9N9YKZ5_9HYPO|nr:unnamed protein product [Clonostachys rhizophaga]
MYFTNIFLFGLVATATALPQKRGGRRKCSSVFPSTTRTSDHVSTTPILSSSSSIIVTPSSSDPISTPVVSTPASSSATPGTSSEVASTPISSESTATTPGTTPPASTTPESSTIVSSTPSSSNESSTSVASSTDSGSIVPSSTPSSTSESSTPVASSTVSSSTNASTTSIASTTAASTVGARPRPTAAGDIPAGVEYSGYVIPGQVGLAFAQGPYAYTAQALDLLDASGFKATFFLNGDNFGSIYDYSSVVQRIYSSGHQVGSNTWSNADLDTLNKNGIESQLYQLEDALRGIIGVYPTYLLPPNGKTNQLVRDTAASLGYKIIKPDITYDEQHQSDISTATNNFIAGLDAGGSIALVHDVYQATVESMLPAMLGDQR